MSPRKLLPGVASPAKRATSFAPAGIEAILNRTNPGPGGCYDDLGNPAAQPHLERGPSYAEHPDYFVQQMINYLVFGGGVNPQSPEAGGAGKGPVIAEVLLIGK